MVNGQGEHEENTQRRQVPQSPGRHDEVQSPQEVDGPVEKHRNGDAGDEKRQRPYLDCPRDLEVDDVEADIPAKLGVDDSEGNLVQKEKHLLPVVPGHSAEGQAGDYQGRVDEKAQQQQAQPQKVNGQGPGNGSHGQGQRYRYVEGHHGGRQHAANDVKGRLDESDVQVNEAVAQLGVPQIIGIYGNGEPGYRYHDAQYEQNQQPAAHLVIPGGSEPGQRRHGYLVGIVNQVVAHWQLPWTGLAGTHEEARTRTYVLVGQVIRIDGRFSVRHELVEGPYPGGSTNLS